MQAMLTATPPSDPGQTKIKHQPGSGPFLCSGGWGMLVKIALHSVPLWLQLQVIVHKPQSWLYSLQPVRRTGLQKGKASSS